MVATSGGTASLIRLAITGRRAELADKERQQAAIAHLHNKAERYPGQRAAYPIAICTSCSARWIQDGHQQRAINQVQEPSLMALGPR